MKPSRWFSKLSIRNKFLAVFLIVFLPLASLGSAFVYHQVKTAIQANIESELRNTPAIIRNMVRTAASVSIRRNPPLYQIGRRSGNQSQRRPVSGPQGQSGRDSGCPPRHIGHQAPGSPNSPIPADGIHRHAGRGHCARFQQSADGHSGTDLAHIPGPRPRPSLPLAFASHRRPHSKRHEPDPAASRHRQGRKIRGQATGCQ